MEKIDIKSMTPEELCAELPDLPKFRVKQIFSWLHRGVVSFDEMTDISKEMRAMLAERYEIACAQTILKRVSKDGTIKYLFQMNDGELIESVLMKYGHGYSICISTQVGCKMNCSFCATGMSGFSRDLLPSEMLSQIQEIQRDEHIRISNIVLMGMGEPLDNYDNVIRFLELVSHPDGINMGMRHISYLVAV